MFENYHEILIMKNHHNPHTSRSLRDVNELSTKENTETTNIEILPVPIPMLETNWNQNTN